MKKKKLSEIANLLKKFQKFIITSHTNLDGDALGSELGLYFILKQLGKNVKIVNQDHVPMIYKFMPGIDKIISSDTFDKKNLVEIEVDTVLIVLDSSNWERIGNIPLDIRKINTIINIDHHTSNNGFGHINYVDSSASSVGEIIFQLCLELNCELTKEIAITLFSAIVTDTGSFRYAITKADTFLAAYHLVKSGANPHLITDYIYNNNKISTLKLLGESLLKLQVDSKSKISWTIVTKEMMENTFAKEEETEGIIDKILAIKKVQIAVLFRETKDGKIKVSFRSRGKFNVDLFAQQFGGGGHPNASGCQIEGDINNISKLILDKLIEEFYFLEKI